MTHNRVTLAQAVGFPVKEVASLPIDQIELLLEDVAALKAHAKNADEHLFAALSLRFSDTASDTRKAKGVDTGTVRWSDGDYVVVADLPKKVTWNNDMLATVAVKLTEMGEPVSDYISIKRDVAEKQYSAWPASLKKLFDPARTVSVGKASFKLERKKGSA